MQNESSKDCSSSSHSNDKSLSNILAQNDSDNLEIPKKKSKYRPSYFTPKIKFSPEEDLLLIDAVKNLGTNVWNDIAQKVPGRNARQCRERWNNYLDPSLISAPWTPEEDNFLLQKRQELGLHWQTISSFFPKRSKNSIKNRYSILIRRQNKKNRKEKNKIQTTFQDYLEKSRASTTSQSSPNPTFSDSKDSSLKKIPAIFNLDDALIEFDDFCFLTENIAPIQNVHKKLVDEYNSSVALIF